jgi:uncharacterized metal-binding protein YceD (DUF177 family)
LNIVECVTVATGLATLCLLLMCARLIRKVEAYVDADFANKNAEEAKARTDDEPDDPDGWWNREPT